MSFETIAPSAACALSVFIATLLLVERPRARDHRVAMAALMLANAVIQLVALGAAHRPEHGPLIGVLALPAMFVMPAAALVYVRRLTNPGAPERLARHAIAPVLAALAASPFFLLDAATLAAIAKSEPVPAPPLALILAGFGTLIMVLVFLIATTLYLTAALRLVSRHNAHIRARYSNIEGKALDWLRKQILLLLLVWALFGARIVLDLIDAPALPALHDALDVAGAVLAPAWVFALGLMCLRQPAIILEPAPAATLKPQLAAEAADRILARLDTAMRDQKLYEKSTLTLRDLAQAVGASEHHLSDALNHRRGVTFYDMVNHARIEAAITIFRSEPETTALDAMLRVGFNARSTFNAAFKKATGRTPSAYRAQIARG